MASIKDIKNKDGTTSYKVIWRVGAGKDRTQDYKTFRKREDARAHRRTVEGEIEAQRVGTSKRESTFEYLDGWLNRKQNDKRNPISPKSLEGYIRNMGIFKRGLIGVLGEEKATKLPLSRLTKTLLEDSYDWLLKCGNARRDAKGQPLARRTVHHVHAVMHNALDDAERAKFITRSPAAHADAPRVQGKKYRRKVRDFTKDEVIRQLDIAAHDKGRAPDTYPMVATLAVTGVRRGELAGLALDALDIVEPDASGNYSISIFRSVVEIDDDLVKVDVRDKEMICAVYGDIVVKQTPKSDASVRQIKIPPVLAALLRLQRARVVADALKLGEDYHREPMFLFPGPMGLPMHPRLITRRMERLIAAANIDDAKVSPVHSWRHTSSTLLWHAHKNIKQVQERAGHSTSQITMDLYTHNTPEAEDEAADFFGGLIGEKTDLKIVDGRE